LGRHSLVRPALQVNHTRGEGRWAKRTKVVSAPQCGQRCVVAVGQFGVVHRAAPGRDGGDAAAGVVLVDLAHGEALVGDDRLGRRRQAVFQPGLKLGVDVVLLAGGGVDEDRHERFRPPHHRHRDRSSVRLLAAPARG
jgi:hypothetical protein